MKFAGSDHRPLISILDPTKKKGNRIFRFDMRLRDNEEVKQIVSNIWKQFNHQTVEARYRSILASYRRSNHQGSPSFLQNRAPASFNKYNIRQVNLES